MHRRFPNIRLTQGKILRPCLDERGRWSRLERILVCVLVEMAFYRELLKFVACGHIKIWAASAHFNAILQAKVLIKLWELVLHLIIINFILRVALPLAGELNILMWTKILIRFLGWRSALLQFTQLSASRLFFGQKLASVRVKRLIKHPSLGLASLC